MPMPLPRLQELRKEKGWNQVHMQSDERICIDQSDLSKFERGIKSIPLSKACILADVFNTSLDYIAELTDERMPYPPQTVDPERLSPEEQQRGLTGYRLRECRQSQNKTQKDIMASTGINQSNYAKMEGGKRQIDFYRCRMFAHYLNTSMDYLAGRTDYKAAYPAPEQK